VTLVWLYELRKHTTCRIDVHSRRKIRAYGGGRYPLVCRYCRKPVERKKLGHSAYG
jgi:hypothetical protein